MSTTCQQKKGIPASKSTAAALLQAKAQYYLQPLQETRPGQVDKQLVATFSTLFTSILLLRNSKTGLLLSELGSYITGYAHAPAGTKRISNLLSSKKWDANLIDAFFFQRTQQRISQLLASHKRPLLLWDDSRLTRNDYDRTDFYDLNKCGRINGYFGPELIEELCKKWCIPTNFMFITPWSTVPVPRERTGWRQAHYLIDPIKLISRKSQR
jgi:hypothetical protein